MIGYINVRLNRFSKHSTLHSIRLWLVFDHFFNPENQLRSVPPKKSTDKLLRSRSRWYFPIAYQFGNPRDASARVGVDDQRFVGQRGSQFVSLA